MNESAASAEPPESTDPALSSSRRWLQTVSACAVFAIGLVGLLWTIGGRPLHYQAQVHILASPEKVFPYLSDPQLMQQWMGDVTEIDPGEDSGNPGQPGATSKLVLYRNGDRLELDSEVLESTPPKELKVRLQNKLFVFVEDYELKSAKDATDLTLNVEANYSGLARITAPLVGSSIEEGLEADFHRLRDKVESTK